jgi:hypothetical protein
VEAFYFGPQRSLYGVLHSDGRPPGGTAALICAPVGQEHVRTHFVLTRLARGLASQGVPTLRFDYYGCWDSLGESGDATIGRWQQDVAAAHAELRRRTGAERVVGVGARLGATLLLGQADFARWVLWDPVIDGSGFHAEAARLQRQYLLSTRHLRALHSPRRARGGEELLGSFFSDAALAELKKLSVLERLNRATVPLRWLITSEPERQRALFDSLAAGRAASGREELEPDCGWQEISRVDDILPDVGISRALAAMVREGL